MKNLLKYTSLILMAFTLSCSDTDNESLESDDLQFDLSSSSSARNSFNFTSKDSIDVVKYANLDMISFVNSISEFYESGDSYLDLKTKLDPIDKLSNMHSKADALLLAAYNHLDTGGLDSDLDGVELLEAYEVILLNAESKDAKDIVDINFDLEYEEFWGSPLTNMARGNCRWFQIGCHLESVWNWLNTKADNGNTNAENIYDVIQVVAGVIGIIVIL